MLTIINTAMLTWPDRLINRSVVPTRPLECAVAVADRGRRLLPFPASMTALLVAVLAAFRASIRSRLELEAEILALRHQLVVLQRPAPRRPRLRRADRLLWVLLSRIWPNWRRAVLIVTPDTVVRWHRRGFALYWRWKSRPRRAGRPAVNVHIRALIRQMHAANPPWGAGRELLGFIWAIGVAVEREPRERPSSVAAWWRHGASTTVDRSNEGGRGAHGKENPRPRYAAAPLVRGSSRRITIMRSRPANISVINRRDSRLGCLRCCCRNRSRIKRA